MWKQAVAAAEYTQLALDKSGYQAVSDNMFKGLSKVAHNQSSHNGGYRRDPSRADGTVRIMRSKLG